MKGDYTKEMYQNEIRLLLLENRYDPTHVAEQTSRMFFLHMADIDLNLREKMLYIMAMDDGPEFELTEEEFKKFLNNI